MTGGVGVSLPGGFWRQGRCYRDARLRPLAGRDEAFLLEAGVALAPAERATALLARCLTGLGPLAPATPAAVQGLNVGDREALLLHLCRLTLGERLQGVVKCPKPDCGERLEMDFAVSDLLLPPYPEVREQYEAMVQDQGATWRFTFRLPVGADQEAAAALAPTDLEQAARLVLERCVARVSRNGGEALPPSDWPAKMVSEFSARLAELDPQAEIRLTAACPACRTSFTLLWDTLDFFCRALAARRHDFYREVHLLAFHYHWSEAEILDLSREKRRLYLGLLAESLAGGKT